MTYQEEPRPRGVHAGAPAGIAILFAVVAGAAFTGHLPGPLQTQFDAFVQSAPNPSTAAAASPAPLAAAHPLVAAGHVSGDTPEARIWNFLIANGFTHEQAAGIMGNLQAESHFDSSIVEYSGGGGYGIAQWTGGRRSLLEAAAERAHVHVSDLVFQLNYLLYDMQNRHTMYYTHYRTVWDAVMAQTTIAGALLVFHNEYEQSYLMNYGDQAVLNARLGLARDVFNSFVH